MTLAGLALAVVLSDVAGAFEGSLFSRGAAAGLLGGADLGPASSGGLGELWAAGALEQVHGERLLSARYSGVLDLWSGGGASDYHAGLCQLGQTRGLGGIAAWEASGFGAWGDLFGGLSLLTSRPSVQRSELSAGPAIRGSTDGIFAGLGLRGSLSLWRRSDRGSLGQATLRLWPGAQLPLVSSELSWRTTAGLGADWEAYQTAGLSVSLGARPLEPAWVAGLPPAGSSSLRLGVGLSRRVGKRVWLTGQLDGSLTVANGLQPRLVSLLGISSGLRKMDLKLSELSAARADGEVVLRLEAARAEGVAVMGSFSGWKPWPMSRAPDGSWTLRVVLAPGTYEYTYLVDGEPLPPPEAALLRDDGFGGRNGVLVVGGSQRQSYPI